MSWILAEIWTLCLPHSGLLLCNCTIYFPGYLKFYPCDFCDSCTDLFLSLLATISLLTTSQNSSWIERYWRKYVLLPWLFYFCSSSPSDGHSVSFAANLSTGLDPRASTCRHVCLGIRNPVDRFIRVFGNCIILAPFCMILHVFSPFLQDLHKIWWKYANSNQILNKIARKT